MIVRDIMSPNAAYCSPETDIRTIAELMIDYDCGEIPVCDANGRPLGVVTDRDVVCRLVARGVNPIGAAASECMSQPAGSFDQRAELRAFARAN